MRKLLVVILVLGMVAAACGDDGGTALTATIVASETTATTAAPDTTSTVATTDTIDTTDATEVIDPGPLAPEPGTLATLDRGRVQDPLMGSGLHRMDWSDDGHTVLISRRSTTGAGEDLDMLALAALAPAPVVTGLGSEQVLARAWLSSQSTDIIPSATVVYSPDGEDWAAAVIIDDLSVETALLETSDYAAVAPDGPAAVSANVETLDLIAGIFTALVDVTDPEEGWEQIYMGEIECVLGEPLTCVTLSDDGVLRPGDEGDDVEALQNDLKAIGYFTGNADGKYGAQTRAAVASFQTDYLLTADGKAGPQTLELLADVVGGVSNLVVASKNGIGSLAFGTGSEDSYVALVAIFGAADSETGWYQDGCDGHDWFKARWDGFSAVFTDRDGTRQLDGWEVNDLSDLPPGLLIAGGIHAGTKWGNLDAMGADFYDDYLGERWRIPALGFSDGRFVNPVSNPPAAGASIASFGTGTGGFESC